MKLNYICSQRHTVALTSNACIFLFFYKIIKFLHICQIWPFRTLFFYNINLLFDLIPACISVEELYFNQNLECSYSFLHIIKAAKLWNQIPEEMRSSIESFKLFCNKLSSSTSILVST